MAEQISECEELSESEWEKMTHLRDGLLPFLEATKVFSSSKTTPSSPFATCIMAFIQEEIEDKRLFQCEGLSPAYDGMKEKIRHYLVKLGRRTALNRAALLWPPIKLFYMHHATAEQTKEEILDEMDKLASEEPPAPAASVQAHDRSSFLGRIRADRQSLGTSSGDTRVELETYLADKSDQGDDGLAWWAKVGSGKYPRLAILARRYLSIPASSAPSERLFSSGRSIVEWQRNRLKGETIRMLMTLKNWLKVDDDGKELVEVDD